MSGALTRFKIVFTAASKQELPVDWIRHQDLPVVSARALRSGILSQLQAQYPGSSILFVITGAGPEDAADAARVIARLLKPLAVVNVGTCGLNSRASQASPGHVVVPARVMGPDGRVLPSLKHLPFPVPRGLEPVQVPTLQSLGSPLFERDDDLEPFVDMEAWFQHQVMQEHGIAFSCLKVVSDFCDRGTAESYRRNLGLVRMRIREILGFLDASQAEAPAVSVVIPVHNRAWAIRRAVDSVIAQKSQPVEIIVVDDASTDDTRDLLKAYGQKITVISQTENKGVSAARNLGILHASGNWIALLDSDDQWKEDRLSHQIAYLKKNPFYEILQCDEIWIRNGKRVNKRRYHEKKEGWIWADSLERCMISPSCVMISKKLLEKHGLFDMLMPACEDYDLWLRITRQHLVGLNPEADVVRYGGHSDQLSSRYRAMDRFRVYAILKSLEHEQQDDFRMKLEQAALSRLSILAAGAGKRGRHVEVQMYNRTASMIKKGKTRCKDHLYLLNI